MKEKTPCKVKTGGSQRKSILRLTENEHQTQSPTKFVVAPKTFKGDQGPDGKLTINCKW